MSTNYTNFTNGRRCEWGAANVPVCEASQKLVFSFTSPFGTLADEDVCRSIFMADEDVCRSVFMADEDVCRSGTGGAGNPHELRDGLGLPQRFFGVQRAAAGVGEQIRIVAEETCPGWIRGGINRNLEGVFDLESEVFPDGPEILFPRDGRGEFRH
jgi:hypothetical protein